jgi:hypothetical protein
VQEAPVFHTVVVALVLVAAVVALASSWVAIAWIRRPLDPAARALAACSVVSAGVFALVRDAEAWVRVVAIAAVMVMWIATLLVVFRRPS